jgi:PAS domain S-box-containing protein
MSIYPGEKNEMADKEKLNFFKEIDSEIRNIGSKPTVQSNGVNKSTLFPEGSTKSEKIFKALIENSSDITSVIDKQGNFLYVSPSNQRITGFSNEDLIGKSAFDLIHPDDISLVQSIYKKNINIPGRTEAFEFKFKTKTGSFVYLEAIANNLLNDDELQFIVINSWDITDRKQKLEELIKLSSVIEQNPVSIIITDTEGRIKYINKKFTEQSGYNLEDVLNKNPNILKSPVTDRKIFEDLWKTIASGQTWHGQICNRKKNGDLYWEDASISPIKDSSGKIIFYAAAQEDITEKKKILEDINLRDNILNAASFAAHNLLKNTNWSDVMDSIIEKLGVACKVDMVYIFANKLNTNGKLDCDIKFEWVKEGLDSRLNNPHLQNFEYIKNDFGKIRSVLEINQPYYRDIISQDDPVRNLFKYQSLKSILLHPIFIGSEWWGFIGFNDCTDIRVWTDSIRDALGVVADTLGAALYRRKVEENLILAKEKAEESNKLKTNFLANISHELRTPMVGIMGFTEMLSEETTDKSTKAILDIIYSSSQRLMDTMDSILNLSRIETARYEFDAKIINLYPLLKTVFENFKPTAEQRGLEINLQSENTKLYANLDEKFTNQVLSNLIRNAIKYTEKGSITIRAELTNSTSNCINIFISDTGIGIPDEYQKLIFEPFRQVSEGYNRRFEGVGLGLTITKKFVELMGGKLSLVSEMHKGSTFTISFPRINN